jgi:hypothetical protein
MASLVRWMPAPGKWISGLLPPPGICASVAAVKLASATTIMSP